MGKKLTYFQRAQREREKERERVKRADAVARRRAEAKRIREREQEAIAEQRARQRNTEKRQREQEALRIKIQKEEELEAKIRNAKNEVESYEAFVNSITKLHLTESIKSYKRFHEAFKEESKFNSSIVKEPIQPKAVSLYNFKAKEFEFDIKYFHFKEDKQLREAKEYVNFSPEQYCTLMKKYKPSVFGWLIYFIILFPIALLHFLGARKNFYTTSKYNDFILHQQNEIYRLESDKETKRIIFEKEQEVKKQQAFEKHQREENARKIKEKDDYENSLKNYSILLEKYNQDLKVYHVEIEQKKKAHEQNELIKTKWYAKLINGEKDAVEEMLELLFPINFSLNDEFVDADPSEVEVGFNVLNHTAVDMSISFDKEMKYIPETGYKLTASGKEVSEYNLTQKAKNEYSNAFICSLALAYVKAVFEYCKSIETLRLELTVPSTNKKTGEYEEEILLFLNANRSAYNKIIYSNIDPVEAITNFEHEHKPIENQKIQIASKLDNDNIIWATKEDTGVEINAVIKRAFKKLSYTI
jgi:hypothetical protein